MPHPRGYGYARISPRGGGGMVREGGLTQNACGLDTVSFRRGPPVRQADVVSASQRAGTVDNTRLLLLAGVAMVAVWALAR